MAVAMVEHSVKTGQLIDAYARMARGGPEPSPELREYAYGGRAQLPHLSSGLLAAEASPWIGRLIPQCDVATPERSGPFDEVVGLLGQARFAPVFHRPLFRHLGFVTNRTFETFYADSLPVLMLPRDFVAALYGEAALTLVPGEDIAAHLRDALARPEIYWDALLKTRDHLARHHSYAARFQELEKLSADPARCGRAP